MELLALLIKNKKVFPSNILRNIKKAQLIKNLKNNKREKCIPLFYNLKKRQSK
jgi:hypothetical protein